MSQDNGLELKVGSFVLMAIIALTFFILSVSDLSIFEKGRHIKVVFGFASGLREAAPVRLAGVEVGLIKKLQVFVDKNDGGKTKVRVNVWIKDDISIPADSKVKKPIVPAVAAARSTKGAREIPGVRIFNRPVIAVNAR